MNPNPMYSMQMSNPHSNNMDDRKRNYETASIYSGSEDPSKRMRTDEWLTVCRDDPSKPTIRLMLNRHQFSRIIGKGGQTINQVRQATNSFVKGFDIDEDVRVLVIAGNLDSVCQAFDRIVDLLSLNTGYDSVSSVFGDVPLGHLSLIFLLDHGKAGRAVGTRGSMMQQIKVRGGAQTIRIDKDPIHMQGAFLRKLTFEGTVAAAKRVHILLQELYVDQTHLHSSITFANLKSNIVPDATGAFGGAHHPITTPHTMMGGASAGIGAVPQVPTTSHDGLPVLTTDVIEDLRVPFPNLVSIGVPEQTVMQLLEMKKYLSQHFKVELLTIKDVPPSVVAAKIAAAAAAAAAAAVTTNTAPGFNLVVPQKQTIEAAIEARKTTHPQDLCFAIPTNVVGPVIGRGGANMRELAARFNLRIYVEKEDFQGQRLTVISPPSGEHHLTEETITDLMQQCEAAIRQLVETALTSPASAVAAAVTSITTSSAATPSEQNPTDDKSVPHTDSSAPGDVTVDTSSVHEAADNSDGDI